MTKRISMWSGPRNLSTAIMYSFRERGDTTVVDEPLYGYYLLTTDVRHPGDKAVMAAMNCDGASVVNDVLLGEYETENVFFKNMAHHIKGLDKTFLDELENVLLTRHPADMLTSLIEHVPNPCLRDTGLRDQTEVLDYLLSKGRAPIVLESQELLKNPRNVLAQLCRKLGIAFEASMLTWEPGRKPEDGVWAEHWYENVHQSTGFAPYVPKRERVPEPLEPLLEECLFYYKRLLPYVLKAGG